MSSGSTMRKISLRNISAHKVRLFLTVLAVVLGTSFVSGAMMFTNALSSTFDEAISSSFDGVDVVVTPSSDSSLSGVPVETVDSLRNDDRINNVNINASQSVVLADSDSKAIQATGGSSLSIFYSPDDSVAAAPDLVEGNVPSGTEEVVASQAGAEANGIGVGDSILVVDSSGRFNVTVTGLVAPEIDSDQALNLRMDEAGYLERYTDGVTVPGLTLSAAEGTTPQELVDALSSELGADYSVETGEALVEEATSMIREALSFVQYFLVAFGLIALLVGTFIIANTFSMIVAQRMREFALLRALGTSPGQLTRSVVLEAIIVGIFGSALGVLGGMGLVWAISAVLNSMGMPMGSSVGITPSVVIISLVLGTVVTVVSAWAPARRAGEVKPVEAMRNMESTTVRSMMGRTITGGIILALGIILAVAGAMMNDSSTATRSILVGFGALFVIVGTFFFSAALSMPVVGGLGRIIGAPFGSIGRLAATNSKRNPRRTATTAFALTLGIALVTAIGMLSATMKDAVSDMMEQQYTADYILQGPTNANITMPKDAVNDVREAEGVADVVMVNMNMASVDGQYSYGQMGQNLTFTADGDVSQVISTESVNGSLDLTNPGVIATQAFADQNGWAVGDSLELGAMGQSVGEIELIGTFTGNDAIGQMVVSEASLADTPLADQSVPQLMLVKGEDGIDKEQLRTNLEEAVADYIVISVKSAQEFAGETAAMIDIMMNILYALLALSVIVAIIGIINTLALNVIERRQEIGMLRAVGMKRGQIRTMITLESVQIAIYGAVIGIAIGLGLGWAFVTVMSGEGLDASVSVPWGQVALMLVGSAVVGVIAALWPATKASRTPPLDAITD
ncbi:ABC-type transport system, involved in lipoprotein release, permease component [Corynebacterium deserti GIMN1.010]|uniref:ABC-type transport system, involved in lipoprotein release, permease component n=1 Tax=Corynebacterium deserti GIMN1.010 TaxID=931089 RepID=A0A0M3QA46_9CORY|nr:FtsX-like permease family protein [Corynebacterium deserti]ALC06673.1 ABC-type transport system, involved in lipoprotein release, permease component [Corynebacterium deserti GIMN1.010]